MLDIVVPNGNEAELIEMAYRLGYKQLLFLYRKPTPAPTTQLPVKTLSGVLLSKPTQAYKNTITAAASSEQDREYLEHNPPTIMHDFETIQQPDLMHERTSGLNQVLCKLAAGRTKIYFSFSNILALSGIKRARMLGRIMQNTFLCRKYGVQMGIASFATHPYQMRPPHDLKSYFLQMGMRDDEVKKAFTLNTPA
ncbi:MAG: hypothetical protein HY363_02495 [Candidatus Aenigmarchaeota archaeon]|nr:hypothetical protein [Candidatus Aenigmarchaeota archaeon]